MSRGRILEVRDPAAGVALAQCYLYRKGMFFSYHQGTCAFCSLSDGELFASLDDFNRWSGITGEERTPDEIELFLMLPAEEQAAQVMKVKVEW